MSRSNAVPDTELGLTENEILLLREHQVAAASRTGSQRATSAAEAASARGLLMLDTTSLRVLSHHFERLMGAIQQRLAHVGQIRR
jgi:hypothetical protein